MRDPVPWLEKELPVLREQGLLQPGQEAPILEYYRKRAPAGSNRLVVILFGVLGSLLIGGGILLIIGHNWTQWSRPVRALLSVLPMLVAQVIAAHVLMRRPDSRVWRESLGVVWPLSILAGIALVSQTYHLPGSIDRLLLGWTILVLPVCYLLRSVSALLLFLYAAVSWVMMADRFHHAPYVFWLLLAAVLPLMIYWNRQAPLSGAAALSRWAFIPAVVSGLIQTLRPHDEVIAMTVLSFLAAVVWLAGNRYEAEARSAWTRPFVNLGGLGLALFAYMMTFAGYTGAFWREHGFVSSWREADAITLSVTVLLLVAYGIYARFALVKRQVFALCWATVPLFHLAIGLLPLNVHHAWVVMLASNAYFFLAGLITLRSGLRTERLGQVNAGMIILCLVILSRFFDANLPMLARALVFILIGAGFIAVNIRMTRKRRGTVP